jgi:ketosteroid isomerase-like protein
MAGAGCRKEKPAPPPQTAPVSSDPDKAAVEKVIIDQAKALSDFAASKDPQSYLKFYASDYSGVSEGESESIGDLNNMPADNQYDIQKCNNAGIKETVSNIKVHGDGNLAWAAYDFVQAFGDGDEISGKRTTIFRKENGSWLIVHQHASMRNETDYDNSSGDGDPDSKQ